MAKPSKDLESEIEIATENWIGIDKKENPLEFSAWMNWRRSELGSLLDSEKMTVPTPFPPSTVAAAREYIAVVKMVRKVIGWSNVRAKLPDSPGAWMGGR